LQSCHTSLGGEADQGTAAERQGKKKKKTLSIGQPPAKPKRELLLKYQHQDWILEE
jgi:hypothetical protein